MKKNFNRNRRVGGHGRNESIASSTSGPRSPSATWKMEVILKFVEG